MPCFTIPSDNGSEFHGYAEIETATAMTVYLARPHHPLQRGTNENTNGLIRQYLPKGKSMAKLTQKQCDAVAQRLNTRPRKRYEMKRQNGGSAVNQACRTWWLNSPPTGT